MKIKKSGYLSLAGILFLLFCQSFQSSFQSWSVPKLIFPFSKSETRQDVFLKTVVDPAGRVHLFWVEDFSDKPSELYYAVRDQDWKKEVNLFLGDELTYFDAAITSDWRIHLVWMDDGVYYTSAAIAEAGSLGAWSKPILLDGRRPGYINLVLGENEEIIAVYPVIDEPAGGQIVYSRNGGVSWSSPMMIAEPSAGKVYTRSTAVMGAGNRLHAVFASASLPGGYPPEEIWYVHSTTDLGSWTAPEKLVEGTISDPAIIRYGEQGLLLTLSGTLELRGFFSIASRNNGETWTGLSENFAPGTAGLSRAMRVVVDSNSTVHGVIDGDSPQAVMYISWNPNIGWENLLNISQTYYPEEGTIVSNPTISLRMGNQLSVIYVEGQKGIYEVENTISTGRIAPLPTPTTLSILGQATKETPDVHATSQPVLTQIPGSSEPVEDIELSSSRSLLFASFAVILFLSAVIIVKLKGRT